MHLRLRRTTLVAAALLVALAVAIGAPGVAAAAAQPRLIVGFVDHASASSRTRALGTSTKASIPQLHAAVISVAPGQLVATRARLLARPDVRYVEIDGVAHASGLAQEAANGVAASWLPNDTFLSQQWGLSKIGATDAWDFARGSGTTIAVVDTGVDYIHPDLAGRVDLGRDFVDGDDDPMDVQGHGTHVAGIAAGGADDGTGIAGVAPAARILAVRVLDADGAGNYSQVADGIVYAADHGATVMNLSLGGTDPSELLRAAIDYATAKGVVVTCASGNEGRSTVSYPARYDSCIAVGATDEADAVTDFSNTGPGLDFVAPGAQVLSSIMGGSYDSWDGTSMAAPHVAGLAALLASQGLGRRAIVETMTTTAKDLGPAGVDTVSGVGRIDAAAATLAASRQTFASTDTVAPTVGSLDVGAARTTTTTSWKIGWKLKSRTPFRRIGTSDYTGTTSFNSTHVRGATRTIITTRFARGIVYRRIVVQTRTRTPVRRTTTTVTVNVTATDDQGVDRVSVTVDGATMGIDWGSADGWHVAVPCVAGRHTIVATAWDVANNPGRSSVQRTFVC